MSQRELAILAGVSPVTISRLETNIQIGVKSDKIIPLADALGVTIDYLLGSEEGE
jgi:transcriptional regulator with XRE-family HTH domain|tara:strand:+ start:4875 stop:5039 length:165 start_codon:yes stop_codon:yes gene_type:complete